MAHQAQQEFVVSVKKKFPSHFVRRTVLDFGSLDVNGNNRGFFIGCEYVGVDIGAGPNVDVIKPAKEFFTDAAIDVIISTEMLEHDKDWQDSLRNMYHILTSNGLLIVTCAAPGRIAHGYKLSKPNDSPYTNNYYANVSLAEFDVVLPKEKFKESFLRQVGTDLQFWGIKW